MSATRRTVITPSAEERAEDAALVTYDGDGVRARKDILPFTRVAVCFGRVFQAKEHSSVFSPTDPWMQWTFVRTPTGAQQGHVITPGLPGGALDPVFDNMGAFPHFKSSPPNKEPECVYLLNYKKGRLEYWVGRRGAKAGQPLRLCFSPDKCAGFPTIYLYFGQIARPRSVHELAATAPPLLTKFGGWTSKALIRKWASQYSEAREWVNPETMAEKYEILTNSWKNLPNYVRKALNDNIMERYYSDVYWYMPAHTRKKLYFTFYDTPTGFKLHDNEWGDSTAYPLSVGRAVSVIQNRRAQQLRKRMKRAN